MLSISIHVLIFLHVCHHDKKKSESNCCCPLREYSDYYWSERFPNQQILDSSKVKEFADNIFKFDENVRRLSKQVENTLGKGEIACYKQFLLFPQCFQKPCTADM